MRRLGLGFFSIAVYIIACSYGDPCEYVMCENPYHECRPVQACDVTGSCGTALAACGPQDDSYIPCAHGLPVVDLKGQEVLCGPDARCPVGFHCHEERCCPSKDFGQDLPVCVQDNLAALQRPYERPTLTSHSHPCVDICGNNADCRKPGHLCCIGNCSTQCQATATSILTTTTTTTTIAPVEPVPVLVSTPSGVSDVIVIAGDMPRPPADDIDISRTRINSRADPVSGPKQSRRGPLRAPSLNRGMGRIPAATPQEPRDTVVYNKPVGPQPQKAGQCPNQPKLAICGQPPCDNDDQCPGPTKCCTTDCGRICVTPQEATDRLNKLRPNVFQDIGFGESRPFGQSRDATDPGVFGSTFSKYGLDFALSGPMGVQQNSVPSKSFGFGRQKSYAGLYNPEEGPLYSYGFRPGTSAALSNSILDKDDNNDAGVGFESNAGNNLAKNPQTGDYQGDNSVLGYRLPFPDRPRPFPANDGRSRQALSSGSESGRFGFPDNTGKSRDLGSFPGYGPNGFSESTSGLTYGRLDPGSFGAIDRSDYEKLGLKHPEDEKHEVSKTIERRQEYNQETLKR